MLEISLRISSVGDRSGNYLCKYCLDEQFVVSVVEEFPPSMKIMYPIMGYYFWSWTCYLYWRKFLHMRKCWHRTQAAYWNTAPNCSLLDTTVFRHGGISSIGDISQMMPRVETDRCSQIVAPYCDHFFRLGGISSTSATTPMLVCRRVPTFTRTSTLPTWRNFLH